jgi:AcrR family transcriptional regulator
VAREAGLSSGALYANFDGHADLLLAVVAEMTVQVTTTSPEAVDERAWLRGFAGLVADASDAESQVALLSDLLAAAVRDPAIAQVVGAGIGNSVDRLAAAAGQVRGRARGLPDTDLGVGVSALVLGLSQLRVLLGDEAVSTERCARLFEALATPARRPSRRADS